MIPTSCPRCESGQNFIPKLRENDAHGWQEEYVRCAMCRYELIIRYTTNEIEVLSKKMQRVRDRIADQERRHGQPSGTMVSLEVAVQRDLSTLTTELYARVREVNGSAPHENAA